VVSKQVTTYFFDHVCGKPRRCQFYFFAELLRQSAEHCLKDIVHLLFSRLPELRHESATSHVKVDRV